MKKYTAVLFLMLAISYSSFSQPREPNIIKISPFVFLKGQLIEVHYERAFYNQLSAGIGLAPIIFPPLIGSLLYPVDEFSPGIAIDPEIRWYAKADKVMDGFFIGRYSSNRFSSWTSSGKTEGEILIMLGSLGWEKLLYEIASIKNNTAVYFFMLFGFYKLIKLNYKI